MEIDTGAPEDEWPAFIERSYTTNVKDMFTKALGFPLNVFELTPCWEAAGPLAEGVRRMEAEPEVYRAMEPPSGFGDYEGALVFLRTLAEASAKHPKCRIRVDIF
ncbi:hypothetical protein [Nonomuraea recticatena]|uniref:hypothetical protein n=1 Tax=Nonomuraea recticatena TaxID=46178 RepID=UPI0031FA2BE9